MATDDSSVFERDGRLYRLEKDVEWRDVLVPCDPRPLKSFDPVYEETSLPGVKWYCDGYDVKAFSLVDAKHAERCEVNFRHKMLKFSTKVVRGYWQRLGVLRLQRKCPTLEKVPLGVRLALSFVIQCDVTN